ncbi:MAG: nicotinate-nucleotide--dimethylbenzimidazole phosphoribosyltransferase, partial [Hyphomicrobiaceae bacterium]
MRSSPGAIHLVSFNPIARSSRLNSDIEAQIRARWNQLTKPPGSLGKLEDLVVRYGAIRRDPLPSIGRRAMFIV